MSKPASVQEFRDALEAAIERNPHCCYCERDLTTAPRKKVMLIDRKPQRVACYPCPEAYEVSIQ